METKRPGPELIDPRPAKVARTEGSAHPSDRKPNPKRFRCGPCRKTLHGDKKTHMQKYHIQCKHCNWWARDQHDLFIHSDLVRCRYCDQDVSSCVELVRTHVGRLHCCTVCHTCHRDPVAHRAEAHVQCLHCLVWFKDQGALGQHARVETCRICNAAVSSCRETIGVHLLRIHKQCGPCKRWLPSADEHKSHIERQAACPVADCKTVLCPGQRARHLREEHKLERCIMLGCFALLSPDELQDHLTAEHTCSQCSDGTLYTNVVGHVRRVHTALPVASDTGYRLVKCGAHQAAATPRGVINACRREDGCRLYFNGRLLAPGQRA